MNFKKITAAVSAAVLSLSSVAALATNAASSTTPTNKVGDANNDGYVDARDSSFILNKGNNKNAYVAFWQADFNNDGVVNKVDSNLILQYYANSSVATCILGDANNDGIVDSRDASFILAHGDIDSAYINPYQADFDCNCRIDKNDANLITTYYANSSVKKQVLGDVDGDFKVTNNDAYMLDYFFMNSNVNPILKCNADVDKSGTITRADVDAIFALARKNK